MKLLKAVNSNYSFFKVFKIRLLSIIAVLLIVNTFLYVPDPVYSSSSDRTTSNTVVLTGITDHDGVIYSKFTEEFKKINSDISDIQWLELSDIDSWLTAIQSSNYSIDIIWGSNSTFFDILTNEGLLSPITNETLIDYITTNIQENCLGLELVHKENGEIQWVAASLYKSSSDTDYSVEPIAIPTSRAHHTEAEELIKFILSPDGQELWLGSEVNHQPVINQYLSDISDNSEGVTDKTSPFDQLSLFMAIFVGIYLIKLKERKKRQ